MSFFSLSIKTTFFLLFFTSGFFFVSSEVIAAPIKIGYCACTTVLNDCQAFEIKANKQDEKSCEKKCAAIPEKTTSKYVAPAPNPNTAGDILMEECKKTHAKFEADKKAIEDTSKTQPKTPYSTPILNVEIPGVSFSQPIVKNNVIQSSFLSDYLTGVYKFLIAISITIAIVMVMVGGLQYVLGAASPDMVGKGKTRIKNAVTGLVLLLCVYIILYTVNPQMTLLTSFRLNTIPFSPLLEAQTAASTKRCGELRGTLGVCSKNIVTYGLNNTMLQIINSIPQTDRFLLAAHVWMESGGALGYGARRGPCGEVGPAQFMPTTVEGMGIFKGCCTGMWAPKNNKGEWDGWKSYIKECDGNRDFTDAKTGADLYPKFYRGVAPGTAPKYPGACGHFETASDACVQFFNSKNPDGTVNLVKVKQLLEFSKNLIENNLKRTGGDRAQELCIYNGGVPYGKHASKKYKEFCEKSGGTVTVSAPATTPSQPTVSPSPTPDAPEPDAPASEAFGKPSDGSADK